MYSESQQHENRQAPCTQRTEDWEQVASHEPGGAEDLEATGSPDLAFYVVGALKIGAGAILLVGLWVDLPVRLAAGIVAVLMVGALAMHVKVGDPPVRSIPATLMLLMCGGILLLA